MRSPGRFVLGVAVAPVLALGAAVAALAVGSAYFIRSSARRRWPAVESTAGPLVGSAGITAVAILGVLVFGQHTRTLQVSGTLLGLLGALLLADSLVLTEETGTATPLRLGAFGVLLALGGLCVALKIAGGNRGFGLWALVSPLAVVLLLLAGLAAATYLRGRLAMLNELVPARLKRVEWRLGAGFFLATFGAFAQVQVALLS